MLSFLLMMTACAPRLYTLGADLDTQSGSWTAPENSWESTAPPSDLEAEGYDQGQVIPDFLMLDQYGDEVSLWQFYGQVLIIDISTIWCSPCQKLAEGVQEVSDHFAGDGVVYLTVLTQDLYHEVPDEEDLVYWADYFGIQAPVLGDSEEWAHPLVPNENYPRVLIVDRDMRIAVGEVINPSDESIIEAVEGLL